MWDAYAAVRLLQNEGKDESVVNEGGVGAVLDGIVDVLNFLSRIVFSIVQPATGLLDRVHVVVPHVFEGDPLRGVWEVGEVAFVVRVCIRASSNAVFGVVDALACRSATAECVRVVDLRCRWLVVELIGLRDDCCDCDDDDEQDD